MSPARRASNPNYSMVGAATRGQPVDIRFVCPGCGRRSLPTGRPRCEQCIVELQIANGELGPEAGIIAVTKHRAGVPGITVEQFAAMAAEQKNACAICGVVPTSIADLRIDHNHATGEVRGLLCGTCNTGLGLMRDSPDVLDAALAYLEERGCYGPDTARSDGG